MVNEYLFKNGGKVHRYPVRDKVATFGIIIGHSDEDEGAQSPGTKLTEFDYNHPVAFEFAKHLQGIGVEVDLYVRKYQEQWPDMVDNYINVKEYDLLVELHLNSYNGKVEGSECLYHYKSKKGKLAAQCFQKELVSLFGSNDRGIKGLKPGQRAFGMTARTKWPYLIPEALFVDDPDDEARLREHWDQYDEALTRGSIRYLEALGITPGE